MHRRSGARKYGRLQLRRRRSDEALNTRSQRGWCGMVVGTGAYRNAYGPQAFDLRTRRRILGQQRL